MSRTFVSILLETLPEQLYIPQVIRDTNAGIQPIVLILSLALLLFAAEQSTTAASNTFRQLAEEFNARGNSSQLDSLVGAQKYPAYKLTQDALEHSFDDEDKVELRLAERLAASIERQFGDAFYLRQVSKYRAWQGATHSARRVLKQRFGDVIDSSERVSPDTLGRQFEQLAGEFLRFGDSATAVKAWQHAGLIQTQTGAETQGQRLLQTSLAIARSIGDLDATARSYNLIGGFFQRSGYYLKAGAYFDSARVIRTKLTDEKGLADCLSNIGGAYQALGNRAEAFRFVAEALRLRRQMADTAQICQSLLNMITAFHHDRPDSEVIAWLQEARSLATPTTDGQLQARLLQAEGMIAEDSDGLDSAATLYESALRLAEEHNNAHLTISLLLNLASLRSSQGDYRGALEFYLKAEDRATGGGGSAALATIEHDLGVAYQKLGDIETAVKHYQRSLEIRRRLHLPNDMVETLTSLSDIYLTANDSATATGYLLQASEIARSFENPRLYAGSLAAQARMARQTGTYDVALAQLDSARSIYEQEGDRQGVFNMLIMAADYARLARDSESSAKYVAAARSILQLRDTYANSQSLDLVVGLLYSDRGELDSAYTYLARVVGRLEDSRRNIPDIELRAFQKSSNRFVYEKLVAIFETKYQQGQVECLDSLLRYVELAKSRSLMDAIGQSRGNVRAKVPRAMLLQEQSLLGRIEKTESELAKDDTSLHRGSLLRQLADLNVDLTNVRLRQSLEDPRAEELFQPQPPSVAKLRERLPDDRSAILDYLLMPEQSLLLVVTKTEARVCNLASRPDLTKRLADYLALLQRSVRDESLIDSLNVTASDLAHSVLSEFTKSVSKFDRLYILPDGALSLLPFESLVCGGKYLIERAEVAYLPSLQFLTPKPRTAAREQPRLLVFADPELSANLQPLPYSRKEAQWLSSSFPPIAAWC